MSHLQSPFKPQPVFLSPKHLFRIHHFRVYRRRRLKSFPSRYLPLRCDFPGFDNFLTFLSSQLPHDAFTSALGFASASAAALSISSLRRNSPPSDVGEWILFSSPTPFNRFVLLRCPSISFEDSELLEDVNERLVKEERHFVRINSGRIQLQLRGDGDRRDSDYESRLLKYQRVCVATEDGGVISLDWPENLDLKEERGLDTTLLLVPGTAQGSMDTDVKALVCEALCRGFFPVVMNPRGCAGSPLTTARLFTAADSDDIHRVTQFISKVRPWTTLMGVGWGFGANMLTKYLAEVGERTRITAATCINNPFDLEEATRSSPHSIAIDEKLTAGLKEILLANKELFQGRAKRFDVDKALSAKTVRNFEQAISMVSYGFEEIAEFYSESSTRDLVGELKVPVLFIQSDDGTVPLFSIPRGEIAENPYTSLLLCSSLPSGGSGKSALSWCQHVTVEWLAAVELGLLKGRHPLLKDIDISISPSTGLSLVEGRALDQSSEEDKFLEFTQFSNGLNGHALGTIDTMFEDDHISGSWQDPQSGSVGGNNEVKVADNGGLQQTRSGDASAEEGEESSMDDDKGQVLKSAQAVMSMLDITLPGVLTEEKKQKVLAAMSQGETLMKALEDAVPEEVRGKLTTSVSGILQAQGAKHIGGIPSKPKNEENAGENSSTDGSHNNNHSPDLMQKAETLNPGCSDDNQEVKDNHSPVSDTDIHSSGKTASESEHQMSKNSSEFGSGGDFEESSGEKDSSPPNPNRSENESGPREATTVEDIADFKSNAAESVTKDLTEQMNVESPKMAEVESPSGFSESQSMDKDKEDDQKNENKGMQTVLDQKTTSTPDPGVSSFSVSQALDALTGMDDSTQVAVNSVFGVLEEMITQLEEGSDNQNGEKENEVEEKQIDSPLKKHHIAQGMDADRTLDPRLEIGQESEVEEPNQSFAKGDVSSGRKHLANRKGQEKNDVKTWLVNSKLLDSYPYSVKHVESIPFYAPKPYEDFLRNEYTRRYLLSKIPPKSLDMDTTTALLLDYIPEEGQWTLLGQPGQDGDLTEACEVDNDSKMEVQSSAEEKQRENMIDSQCMVQGPLIKQFLDKEQATMGKEANLDDSGADELKNFLKKIIYDRLRIEVDRRILLQEMKGIDSSLVRDFALIGDAVCSTIAGDEDMALVWKARTNGNYYSRQTLGTLNGDKIVSAVSSAIQETDLLRRLLPIGLVVGSCLAALREFFAITEQESARTESDNEETSKNTGNTNGKPIRMEPFLVKHSKDPDFKKTNADQIDQQHSEKSNGDVPDDSLHHVDKGKPKDGASNGRVMAGVVTAALGTTALFVHHQGSEEGDGGAVTSSKQGGDQMNIVTSIAEKAMSVAAPMVPTKEDGEVDQERLVAMLAEVGQRGGMLKLVAKVALLWGGLRGAMSFTNKLISFLRIGERPLIQRIIAFICMALVLWSPVVVPLIPTLVQGWMSTNNSPKMAELACIVGLYAAVVILVMLWGKRIRGYKKPFRQYGLDLTSMQKVQDFLKGLVGGIVLVSAIQYINMALGYTSFSLPPSLFSASSNAMTKLKVYGTMLVLAGQGIVTAAAIALVEELFFRAWLSEEIATDLGYHWGVFLSGLAFSLSQRPLWAVPGLLLWSVSLAGIRRINGGSLSIPIGLRTGIIAWSHILQTGGFLTYKANFPRWITGTQPFQPFSGVVGVTFSLLLAAILYPRRGLIKPKKPLRIIREE